MGKYSSDPAWADLTPLPTDEGGPNALAAIAYSDDYSETMSYLRAAMACNDLSPRILDLTEDLIDMNPAHYTVWLYRAQALFALNSDLHLELEWLNETALDHQKNYQIWHHRMLIVDRLGESQGEREFVGMMFERDAKNYHVWSYRQWLVRRFALWEDGEVEFTMELIGRDPRNNSAWNHRWFVLNGREEEDSKVHGDGEKMSVVVPGVAGNRDLRDSEIQFAKDAVARAPQNQCPWNYLRGIYRKAGLPLSSLKEFVQQYSSLEHPDDVKSSYALDFLAEILAEEGEDGGDGKGREEAKVALDLLAARYDPIRRNYWEYRKGLLVGGGEKVAA